MKANYLVQFVYVLDHSWSVRLQNHLNSFFRKIDIKQGLVRLEWCAWVQKDAFAEPPNTSITLRNSCFARNVNKTQAHVQDWNASHFWAVQNRCLVHTLLRISVDRFAFRTSNFVSSLIHVTAHNITYVPLVLKYSKLNIVYWRKTGSKPCKTNIGEVWNKLHNEHLTDSARFFD